MPSYGSGVVVQKQLVAPVANAICLTQTPVANHPLILNGTLVQTIPRQGLVAVLDTGRRVLVTSTDASPHTVTLNGVNSQGAPTFETISVPAGGSVQSYFDYATITSVIPDGLPWSGTLTVGTNLVGSTAPQIPAHYQAIFTLGFDVTIANGTICSIECTRDVPFALPQIYVSGYKIIPPQVNWFAWPTMANMTPPISPPPANEVISDIDSPINAWRLTVTSGTGLCVARALPVGLRT